MDRDRTYLRVGIIIGLALAMAWVVYDKTLRSDFTAPSQYHGTAPVIG